MRFQALGTDRRLWLWAVLSDNPTDHLKGLLVVFEPRSRMYGMAVAARKGRPGTFYGFTSSDIGEAISAL
jgi:hypothetical protein